MSAANLDEPRYSVAAVAAAADMDVNILRLWIARGLIPLPAGERAAVPRSPRRLTMRRALHIALAAELVRLGIWAPLATKVAMVFSDAGHGRRRPAELFPDGYTVLVVGGRDPEAWNLVRVTDGFLLLDVFAKHPGAAVVLVDTVVEHVQGALRNRNKETP